MRSSTSARALVALLVVGLLVVPLAAPAAAAQVVIESAGPLTRVVLGDDLNCGVNHRDDQRGEFFGDLACATLVATGGTLYGPANIPAGGSAQPRTEYTLVSQSPVQGAGTSADPFRVVTVVTLGGTGLRLTQTDSYIVGQESYRTDVAIANTGGATQSLLLYRAGDCYLQDSDVGFGSLDTRSGAVSCVSQNDDGTRGTRIEQWLPLSPGSAAFEAGYSEVWAHIGTQQPFPNTCRCDDAIDNGAGLSWQVEVAAGQTQTRSHLTTFSPLGRVPLSVTKTADAPTSAPGAANGYTITIDNPNAEAVTVTSIRDDLPLGFAYAGPTTGVTTGEPVREATGGGPDDTSMDLTWSGEFTIPAGGSASLHFGVTVASQPGTYTNSASATATDYTVTPATETAPIVVQGDGQPPTDPPTDPGDPNPPGPVDRVGGVSRIETAVEVSQTVFGPEGTDVVVIARSDNYPDALAGAPLARVLDAPILLTSPEGLHPSTAAEISRLGSTRAVLLGGPSALSAQVADDLLAQTPVREVQRLSGPSRFHTAAVIARQVGTGQGVYIAEGLDPDPRRGWPDALAASSLAAFQRRPILLVTTEELPEPTSSLLDELDVPAATLVGGRAAISDAVDAAVRRIVPVVDRVAGSGRYVTARLLADRAIQAGETPATTWVASGENFPDALVTGPAAAKTEGVLVLAHPDGLDFSPDTREYFTTYAERVRDTYLLGGPGALGPAVESEIVALVG